MVSYRLVESNDKFITYHYFPNGNEAAGHGVIVINVDACKIELRELAPGDRLIHNSVEKQLEMREAANRMRKAEQMPELTESEWPTPTKERISTDYADYAIRDIILAYNSGEVTEGGSTPCY